MNVSPVQSFHDFGKLVRKAAQKCDVGFETSEYVGRKPQMREVLFLDTHDFALYNNSFILRRRTNYEDGFLVGDPEVVFKFRHSDLQTAAEMDVRPRLPVDYKVKFKAEVLPLKDKIGSHRMLYSHNVEFPLSAVQSHEDRKAFENLVKVLPALKVLQRRRGAACRFRQSCGGNRAFVGHRRSQFRQRGSGAQDLRFRMADAR